MARLSRQAARLVRQGQALLGIVLPAAASQPSLVRADLERNDGPLAAFLMEHLGTPLARVFVVADETAAMRRLIDLHARTPRLARDGRPLVFARKDGALVIGPAQDEAPVFRLPADG